MDLPEKKMMLLSGDKYIPVTTWETDEYFLFKIPPPWVAPSLHQEIRVMQGRTFDYPNKIWKVPKIFRNMISMNYLQQGGEDPFERYFTDLPHVETTRSLWDHQGLMLDHAMHRRCGILAAEQGTGKSLPYIELMERSGFDPNDIWYVSTIPSIESFKLQLRLWESEVIPRIFTFEGFTKTVQEWEQGVLPPKLLIGDESQKLKSPNSKRSNNFHNMAGSIRHYHDPECYIILGTGTPAPKDPTDWWMQCEIVAPAFLKEGSIRFFKNNLALIDFVETDAGQQRPVTITWWDDERKCKKCGMIKEECTGVEHDYQKSVNEVERLSERLEGLVLNIRKEDCLDLPDKHYRVWTLPVAKETERLARATQEHSITAIEALINLRALSDGFRYTQEQIGTEPCSYCTDGQSVEARVEEEYDDDDDTYCDDIEDFEDFEVLGEVSEGVCSFCNGTALVPKYQRTYIPIDTPKLPAVERLLWDNEEGGRVIIYGSFQASLDRVEEVCLKNGWTVFKIDGRGWRCSYPEEVDTNTKKIRKKEMLEVFQRIPPEVALDKSQKLLREAATQKIVWLGHPKSTGTGVTLTESPIEIYYSNPFDADDRMQSEDRAHRPGMDLNKGLTIVDLIHLPSDQLVLDNLKKKVKLQSLTLNDLSKIWNDFTRGTQDEMFCDSGQEDGVPSVETSGVQTTDEEFGAAIC